MKKIAFSVIALSALLSGISAKSHAGFYAGFSNTLFSKIHDKSNISGYQRIINLGYNFPWFVPAEIEGEYSFGKYKSQDVSSYGITGHFFIPAPVVSPYLGYGIGSMEMKSKDQSIHQFVAGVKYKIPVAPIAILAEYRYILGNEADVTQSLLGIKYIF